MRYKTSKDVIKRVKCLFKERGIIILLEGDLASGKTAFVKEFAKSLSLLKRVTSPTFSIMHQYSQEFYHYDLYKIKMDNFLLLWILQNLEKEGYHFIEWPSLLLKKWLIASNFKCLRIKIHIENLDRIYTVEEL